MTRIHRSASLALAAGALLLSSCVSQQEHDKALEQADYYQTEMHELQRANGRLARENQDLRENQGGGPMDASYSDWDAKLSSLEQLGARLAALPEGTQRIDLAGGDYLLVVPDSIIFASGSAELSPDGQDEILRLAAEINAAPHGRIWVRGHTDSDKVVKPSTLQRFPHGNLQLSTARAVEVAAYLIEQGGVTEGDVAVVGFGPHEPLKPNDSADNKRMNRRVEIYVAAD